MNKNHYNERTSEDRFTEVRRDWQYFHRLLKMTWNNLPHDAQKLQLFIVFPLRINFKYQRYHYPFSPVGTGTQYFYLWYPQYNQAKRALPNLLCGARFFANVSAICHEKSMDFHVCYWTVEYLITISSSRTPFWDVLCWMILNYISIPSPQERHLLSRPLSLFAHMRRDR